MDLLCFNVPNFCVHKLSSVFKMPLSCEGAGCGSLCTHSLHYPSYVAGYLEENGLPRYPATPMGLGYISIL